MAWIRVTLLSAIFAASFVAHAQTTGKLAASSVCERSVLHQTASIDDPGQHSISLDQRICIWPAPIRLGNSNSRQYTSTGTDDVQFDRSDDRGYAVGTTDDGDKYFLKYEGTSTMNGAVPVHLEGTWQFTGGTGKLDGLRGRGHYIAKPDAQGGMIFSIEGEYSVEPRPKTNPK